MDKSATTPTAAEQQTKKSPQGRGPAYPFISLEKAIQRADEFRKAEGKHTVPSGSAFKAWGYGAKSSGGRQTSAALRQYGLLDYSEKDGRSDMRLSKLALDILLDFQPESTEKKAHLKTCALTPKIFAELWTKWRDELPSEATMATYLVRDRGYNESSAGDLIKIYKDTIAYAKVSTSDRLPPESLAESVESLNRDEVGGTHMSIEPNPLASNGQVAFLRKNVSIGLEPGERSFLSGPLSKDGANYRILVSGNVGPKEIGKMIKILTLQKAILEDSDEDTVEE